MFPWRRTVAASASRRNRSARSRSALISGAEQLERDRPAEAGVRRAEDRRHPAATDDRVEPVAVRDHPPDEVLRARRDRWLGRGWSWIVPVAHAGTIAQTRRRGAGRHLAGSGRRTAVRNPGRPPGRAAPRPRPGRSRAGRPRHRTRSFPVRGASAGVFGQVYGVVAVNGRSPKQDVGDAGAFGAGQPGGDDGVGGRQDRVEHHGPAGETTTTMSWSTVGRIAGDRREVVRRAARASPSRPCPRRTAVRRRPRCRSARASRLGSPGRTRRRGDRRAGLAIASAMVVPGVIGPAEPCQRSSSRRTGCRCRRRRSRRAGRPAPVASGSASGVVLSSTADFADGLAGERPVVRRSPARPSSGGGHRVLEQAQLELHRAGSARPRRRSAPARCSWLASPARTAAWKRGRRSGP